MFAVYGTKRRFLILLFRREEKMLSLIFPWLYTQDICAVICVYDDVRRYPLCPDNLCVCMARVSDERPMPVSIFICLQLCVERPSVFFYTINKRERERESVPVFVCASLSLSLMWIHTHIDTQGVRKGYRTPMSAGPLFPSRSFGKKPQTR